MSIFYRAFEDNFRGSRNDIKARLGIYLPAVSEVALSHSGGLCVDLGCGRGEWLELLGQAGVNAKGFDLDDDMLSACHQQGLDAQKTDALQGLSQLSDESVSVVTAFHLVEHIPFDALQQLLYEAHRVLRPGGLLILETPNPENISVATCHFYLDPSHQKPIPPLLLQFATDHAKFFRSRVVRLQEKEAFRHSGARVILPDVLHEVSPDYAVVAQKSGEGFFPKSDALFERSFGVSLLDLSHRFQQQLNDQLTHLGTSDQSHHTKIMRLQNQLVNVMEEQSHLKQQLSQLHDKFELTTQWATQTQALLGSVLTSRSWRMTYPLRLLAKFGYVFKRRAISWLRLEQGSRPYRMLQRVYFWLRQHPKWLSAALKLASFIPVLKVYAAKAELISPALSKRMDESSPVHMGNRAITIYKQIQSVKSKASE